jgi:predicted Abi (CAAX) family protease
MEHIRKKILKVHGSIAVVAGTAFAIVSTIGMMNGVGPFKFLQQDKLGHVGLFQAYALFALIGVVLLLGSRQENVRKWNRLGAAAHALILIVYVIHWNFFLTIDGGDLMRTGGLIFHCVFLSMESWAGFT